jgi:hypothetical protein
MANIAGANDALPGAYSDTVTDTRAANVSVGSRIAAIIGEGNSQETLVSSANGSGKDGLDPTYTSSSGSDGRHFLLSAYPVISNRTSLYRNGVKLVGTESVIDSGSFSNKYDYRIDPATGQIELQKAHLVDQGGSYYTPVSTNVGLGSLSSLQLLDVNAPQETWTVRCVSVQRNGGNPIQDTAKFIAIGSLSGQKLDANGNPVIWTANNTVVSNGVLSFAIGETKNLGTSVSPFREGDAFTLSVKSGVLTKSNSLTATYIAELNINDPVLISDFDSFVARHGAPTTDNTLSLGAFLAFSNAAPALVAVQAAPAMPRRQSFDLVDDFKATSTSTDDFVFPLPSGIAPDVDANIHFFVTNNSTNVEAQVLPNKYEFYTLGTSGKPTVNAFALDNVAYPGGNSYSYSVINAAATIASGFDGAITRGNLFSDGYLGSSILFDLSYVGKSVKIIDALNVSNNGTFTVSAVSSGKLKFESLTFPDFTSGTSIAFEIIDPNTGLAVDGYASTDGALVPNVGVFTAAFTSAAIAFTGLGTPTNYKLKINGNAANNGLYDITSFNSGTDTLTIRKGFTAETGLRYEVLDNTDTSNYVVVNKNVVPNGYSLRVSLIDEKDASFYDPGWVNALEALEVSEVDVVVPLPKQTISVIFQNTLNHCLAMSSTKNRKERVLFCGAIAGLTPENVIGTKPAAVENLGILEGIQGDSVTEILSGNVEDLANYSVPNAFGNTYRCAYFYPDQIVVNANGTNTLVDGFYQAAAAAGYIAATSKIEEPLTRKTLSGYTILRNKQYRPSVLESLVAAGICVLQPVSGGGRIVSGCTTSQSGFVEEQEISIVFIRDYVSKKLRAGFEGMVGTAESPLTPILMTNRAISLLSGLVSDKAITKYANLKVERDSVDPRQWNVGVKVQPTYGINFIYIKINVGLI